MVLNLSQIFPNGSGRTISPLSGALPDGKDRTDARAKIETFVLDSERTSAALTGLIPVIDVQDDPRPLATAARGYARALLAQVNLAFDLRPSGLEVTNEQMDRLVEVKDELSELIDTLNWTLDASNQLADIIKSECA
jgi:hypothetical protein